MKLLALSALLCALMALALAADAAEPESQPEPESESGPESEPESGHEEAEPETAAVEKRFFNIGNTHNTNSGNTDNKSNFGNTDNRNNFGNKNNKHISENNFGSGNSEIHFAVEKRIFCWPWRPRPRWTRIGRRYFLYVPYRRTWHQAERKCRRLGGHLASVRSRCEYQQIRNLIRRQSGHHSRAWIGGTDQYCEGHWKWSDGSRFNYKGWCRGEPNNDRNQDCLQINYSSHKCWDDLWCNHKLPSICVRKRRW